jgi:hypothetical protein
MRALLAAFAALCLAFAPAPFPKRPATRLGMPPRPVPVPPAPGLRVPARPVPALPFLLDDRDHNGRHVFQ